MPAIAFGVGIALAGWIAYLYAQRAYWERYAKEIFDQYSEVLNRALYAEGMYRRTEADMDHFKRTLVTLVQRPVMATLSDEQVHSLTHAIMSYIQAHLEPNRMN